MNIDEPSHIIGYSLYTCLESFGNPHCNWQTLVVVDHNLRTTLPIVVVLIIVKARSPQIIQISSIVCGVSASKMAGALNPLPKRKRLPRSVSGSELNPKEQGIRAGKGDVSG